jgi:hypothetical protein
MLVDSLYRTRSTFSESFIDLRLIRKFCLIKRIGSSAIPAVEICPEQVLSASHLHRLLR